MRAPRLARNDLLVLGLLALLVAGALIFPWSVMKEVLVRKEAGEYAFAKIRQDLKRGSQSAPDWRAPTDYAAETRYSPETGTLRIALSNKHGSSVSGLELRAEFSEPGGARPSRAAWLRHEEGGRYVAGDVKLPRGDWIMSLTASHPSGPLFRLEQAVTVD